MDNYKTIHIGKIIKQRMLESCCKEDDFFSAFRISKKEMQNIFDSESINSEVLLEICKILNYNFFRIYSQHLSMYSNCYQSKSNLRKPKKLIINKSIYNREIINFVLELIKTRTKTEQQIINEYNIPKTTLLKWIRKYG